MSKEDVIEYLNSIFPLSPALNEYLYSILKSKDFAKREYWLEAGQVSRNVYFIKSGIVRAFYIKNGKEICSWFMKEGDVIFSVESFYNQTPSYEYIQSLENSSGYYITNSKLQHIYRTYIEFNFVGRVLTEKYYTLSQQRLHSMRMEKATDRFQYLLDNHPDLVQRVPKKHLASYLGISDETLSRKKTIRKIDKCQ